MAQDSSMGLRPLTHRGTSATSTTTSTSTTTATTTTTTITGREHWEHHGMDGISESELRSPCSFVGFDLESKPTRLFSDTRQIVRKNGNSPSKETRKRSFSGLNGVIRKAECGNSPLSVSENVESNSVHSLQKVLIEENKLQYGVKKRDNLVNIEKISLHDNTHPEVEDVCFIGIGGDGLKDDDESSTDIIIIKEIVNNDSPLAVSGVQQNSDSVQPSKERNKETELVPPYHCVAYKEPSPLVVKFPPDICSLDHQIEVEQEDHYHLFGAPEIIEEVIAVDDMEVVSEEFPNTNTFSSPVSSVVLDHSYSSLPPQICLQETFNPSQEEEEQEIESEGHIEKTLCGTSSASTQDGSDWEDCEAKNSILEMIDAISTCQSDGDFSDGWRSAAANSNVPHCSEVTTSLHVPNGDERGGLNKTETKTNPIVHPHLVIRAELHPQDGDTSEGMSSATTNNSVHHHPHITTGNIPCEQNKLHQEQFVTDGTVNFEDFENVKILLNNTLTSQPEGKSDKKYVEDPKLDSSGNNFDDGNSQNHKTAEMNVQSDESKECVQTFGNDNDMTQRAESQERMLIRSSIQLRKRKIYKLIQVPQRKSINYDKICDIDTYYTKDVTCVENDLPVSKEKEMEKPPDLFPSSKAEKKAVSKIWHVLVSQLEDCVRGISTLPPAVAVHSKKRKRSLSRGKKKGSGCVTLKSRKVSDDHNISVTNPLESQDSRTIQCVEGESGQTTQTCSESRVPVIKRKSVCFCRYNTVLPLASRRTCCGRKRAKSGCRRSSRTANSDDIVYPTNQKSFFGSLGLMEKSLYDKDVYYESLVTHRTRKMRANQIKGKDHYRTFLDNLHGYCLDQNNEKLKQPLPLICISKQRLCKLSTKSKAISKVSNVEWYVDGHVANYNFEGFGGTQSKESGSTSGLSSGQHCNFETSVNLGDIDSSMNNSEPLPSMSFCCTDTNDNFTENYTVPKTQDSQLEVSKTSVNIEECPVCEQSGDGICSLDHKVKIEPLSKRILQSHSCEILQEEDHGSFVTEGKGLQASQTKDKESKCPVKVNDEGCFNSTLLDSWQVSEKYSTMDSDCTMEVDENAAAESGTDEHSTAAEPCTDVLSMSKSDIIVMDDNSDVNSEDSLPDLWKVGTENARSISSELKAAASPVSDTMSVSSCITQEQFKDSTMQRDSEDCDFLGFDNEANCLKYGLQTASHGAGKESRITVPQDFPSRDRGDGKSESKYIEYQRRLMTLITQQYDSMDVSKEMEDVSCCGAIPKVPVKEGGDVICPDGLKLCKGKLARTSNMEDKDEIEEEDEAAESVMNMDTLLQDNHTSKCFEVESGSVLSLPTETETLKPSVSPTLMSPKKNEKMSMKLPEFDLTRNCRVNLTKIQIPESALEGIRIDTQDSIISPLFSSNLSPEKLIKRDKKTEPETCITLSRCSERLNVRRINYSELLKPKMRRSLNGMCEKEKPLSSYATKHTRSISDGMVFKCSTCLLSFRSKSALNTHSQTHEKMEFTCGECGLSFQQELELESHTRLHTTARQAVLCEKCGESFSQLEDLRNHVKNHLSPRSLKCKMCHQSCKCQTSLNEPLNFHLKDCKNKCVECSESFVAPTNPRRHTRTHSRGKVHQCPLCKVNPSHSN